MRQRFASPWVTVVTALALALTAAAAVAQDRDAERLQERFQKGLELLQEGQADEAREELEWVAERAPDHAGVHFYLASAYGSLQRFPDAYDHFARAAELQPGWGEAHTRACTAAFYQEDFGNAWQQCLLAAQAGEEVEQAFVELQQRQPGPEGWQQLVSAPRVLIADYDMEGVLQTDSGPFAARNRETRTSADTRGSGVGDPFEGERGGPGQGSSGDSAAGLGQGSSTGAPTGFGEAASGSSLAAQVQAELSEVNRQFGVQLLDSPAFGVVRERDKAQYIFQLDVDDVSESTPRTVEGRMRIFDAATGEQIHSRPLELGNSASVADIRNDVSRHVGYLERWLREQRGE